MKQFIISLIVSLIVLYLVVSFISLTPNIAEWGSGGRGAYLFFGALFGGIAYVIHYETNNK
jgi:hypothetical protein